MLSDRAAVLEVWSQNPRREGFPRAQGVQEVKTFFHNNTKALITLKKQHQKKRPLILSWGMNFNF